MEFPKFLHLLFLLYLTCTHVLSQTNFRNQRALRNPTSAAKLAETIEHLTKTEGPRDKRALGLILSGLAQVFGYTVNPVQLASLPNPNTASAAVSTVPVTTVQPVAPSQSISPPAATTTTQATTTTAPRQRETLRFTGVVNFGNNSDIVGHLRQYETIFHGGATTPTPTVITATIPPRSSSTTFSSIDPDAFFAAKPPLLAPLLVKIPLPIAINTRAPPVSKSETVLPVQKEQEKIYRNNENIENFSVTDKDIYDEREVTTPGSKYTHDLYVGEPYWKKQHEDRLAELERKQQEHADRLRQQEEWRNDKEDDSREREIQERNRNRTEEIASRYPKQREEKREENDHAREEDEGSKEKYEDREKFEGYPSRDNSGESRDKDESAKDDESDEEKHRERYKDFESFEESPIEKPANYTGAKYKQPLPISDYYKKPKSEKEKLRDSYGEVLNDDGLIDEGVADYFTRFKKLQNSSSYSKPASNSGKNSKKEKDEDSSEKSRERFEEKLKRLREEYALPPPQNKYEEYNLDEGGSKEDENKSVRLINVENTTSKKSYVTKSRPGDRYMKLIPSLESAEVDTVEVPKSNLSDSIFIKSKESSKEDPDNSTTRKQVYNTTAVQGAPFLVPVRYVYAPDQSEEAKLLNSQESDKYVRIPQEVTREKSRQKEVKKEEPKVTASLPQKLPKNLHEGEVKEHQMWPAPFDYVFDSTEQTNVIVPADLQKFRTPHGKSVGGAVQQSRTYLPPSVADYRDYPQNVQYFNGDPVSQNAGYAPNRQEHPGYYFTPVPNFNHTPNTEENRKNNQEWYQQQSEEPEYFDRYRYVYEDHGPPNVVPVDSTKANVPYVQSVPVQNVQYENFDKPYPEEFSHRHDIPQNEPTADPYYQQRTSQIRNNSPEKISYENSPNVEISKSVEIDKPESPPDYYGLSEDGYTSKGKTIQKKYEENKNITQTTDKEETNGSILPAPAYQYHDIYR